MNRKEEKQLWIDSIFHSQVNGRRYSTKDFSRKRIRLNEPETLSCNEVSSQILHDEPQCDSQYKKKTLWKILYSFPNIH